MKKILFTIFCMYALIGHTQTVLKVAINKFSIEKEPVVIESGIKTISLIDSINENIKKFNSKKNSQLLVDSNNPITLLNSLVGELKLLDTLPAIKKMIVDISSKIKNTPLQKIIIDTIQTSDDQKKLPESGCIGMSKATIKFLLSDNDSYIGVITDNTGNALSSFTIVQLNKELFYDKLKKALKDICDDEDNVTQLIVNFQSVDLYTQFLEAREDLANTNGLAGILLINKKTFIDTGEVKVPIKKGNAPKKEIPEINSAYYQKADKKNVNIFYAVNREYLETSENRIALKNKNTLLENNNNAGSVQGKGKIGDFTIHELQIQFQDGFIENIKVLGKVKGNTHLFKFENYYPIAFSTKRDFRNLIDKYLIEKSNYTKYGKYKLILGEILSYNANYAIYNKDYSPANQVLTIKSLPADTTEIALYKEQTSKILEAKVFSDLKGVDNNNPNGLIQVELSKRLNFWSNRRSLFHNSGNIGFFNYITPQFSLNKVEDNQKRLILNSIDTLTLAADSSKPITYTSTISLLRHQVYNVGFDLSLLLIDIPGFKSTFNIGVGLNFGRIAIQDTLRTRNANSGLSFSPAPTNNVMDYGVNTFQRGTFITWQIFPDGRFGVSATQRFTWFKALTSNFMQVRDSADYLKFIAATDKKQIINTAYLFKRTIATSEIYAYFNLNNIDNSSQVKNTNNGSNNKLFFRYRLNWDMMNPKENYHQIQIGFSTFITATKEYDKLKKSANLF